MRTRKLHFSLFCVLILSACAVTATPTATPMPIETPADSVRGCQGLGFPEYHDQLGYLGIFPGISIAQEVLDEFGEPSSVYKPEESLADAPETINWYWQQLSLWIEITDGLVKEIYRGNWYSDDQETFLPLESYLLKYGCPTVIMQIGGEPCCDHGNCECPSDLIILGYSENGFSIWYEGVTVEQTSFPLSFVFFLPINTEAYWRTIGARLASWDVVVNLD